MKLSHDITVMTRALIASFCMMSFTLMMTCISCDDEKLEASTVTFSGTILNPDFSRASNLKFEILVRTNPDFDMDTTISVRIPVTTDASGSYNLAVKTDGFPAIPFYTVGPLSKSMVSLEIPAGHCVSRVLHLPVSLDHNNIMTARFGAAAFVNVTVHKAEESSATSARFEQCTQTIITTIAQPDTTFTVKVAYEMVPNPYTFSYVIMYGEFVAESRLMEVVLQPYDTVDVNLTY
jgi:hypothetical protein